MIRQPFERAEFGWFLRHAASILTLLLLGGCAFSAQSRPEPRPVPKDQPQENQSDPTQEALEAIATELGAIRNEAAKREQDQKTSELKVWGDTVPNWVSVFVGALGVGGTIYTLILLRRQSELTRRAADMASRNAIAAVANARAAKAAANTAEQHMYLAMRARMGFVRIRTLNFEPLGATVFKLRFQNFGGKGADVIDCHAVVNLGPLPKAPTYTAGAIRVSLGTPCEAGDRIVITLLMLARLSQDQWDDLHADPPRDELFLYGVLRYMPGMTREVKHVAFCRRYDPILSKREQKPVFVGSGPDTYNYAD